MAGNGFTATAAPASEAAARAQVRKGKPSLVLLVPAGFGADPVYVESFEYQLLNPRRKALIEAMSAKVAPTSRSDPI